MTACGTGPDVPRVVEEYGPKELGVRGLTRQRELSRTNVRGPPEHPAKDHPTKIPGRFSLNGR